LQKSTFSQRFGNMGRIVGSKYDETKATFLFNNKIFRFKASFAESHRARTTGFGEFFPESKLTNKLANDGKMSDEVTDLFA
jgi:hypothetical protein